MFQIAVYCKHQYDQKGEWKLAKTSDGRIYEFETEEEATDNLKYWGDAYSRGLVKVVEKGASPLI